MTSHNFTVPLQNLGALRQRIEQLSKKGGTFQLSLIGQPFPRNEKFLINGDEAVMSVQYVRISIDGLAPPVLDGWSVIATIDKLDDGKNLVYSMPGANLPEHYRTCDHICEHCNTRRDRKKSFVLQHAKHGIRMIGSACLAEYLGHPDASSLGHAASQILRVITAVDDAALDKATPPRGVNVKEYLAVVVNLASRFGYEKSDSTNATARNALEGYFTGKIQPGSDERQTVEKMLDWINRSIEVSEFITNLKLVCGMEYVDIKHTNVLAALYLAFKHANRGQGGGSIVPAGRNWVEGHVLSVKQKLDLERGCTVHKMLVEDPRGFKVYGTIPTSFVNQVREGCIIKFKGTLTHTEPGFGYFSRPSNTQVMTDSVRH